MQTNCRGRTRISPRGRRGALSAARSPPATGGQAHCGTPSIGPANPGGVASLVVSWRTAFFTIADCELAYGGGNGGRQSVACVLVTCSTGSEILVVLNIQTVNTQLERLFAIGISQIGCEVLYPNKGMPALCMGPLDHGKVPCVLSLNLHQD